MHGNIASCACCLEKVQGSCAALVVYVDTVLFSVELSHRKISFNFLAPQNSGALARGARTTGGKDVDNLFENQPQLFVFYAPPSVTVLVTAPQ